mgnify:CR=1 FL=1
MRTEDLWINRSIIVTTQPELGNTRLKRAVTDLTLDNQILKEAVEGNF